MHVLHALFTSQLGGLEASYIDTTEALAAKGHKVSALLRADAPYFQDVSKHAHALYTARPTGFYDIITAWKIRSILRRHRPDIILAHNARAISLLQLAAFATGIPVIGVTHSYKTARTIRADQLVVLTPHMRDHFIQAGYPQERTHIIPNLIRLPIITPVPKARGTPVVIGAMGRFTAEKGFENFLKALQTLINNGIPCTALIGGSGDENGQLKLLAEKLGLSPHIHWEGWVKDKAAFYSKLDIMCVPSLKESFGLVVIEALAHGVPIVATDTPGPISILTHEVNGLIVPRTNHHALAAALQHLIDNRELAAKLAKEGLSRARDFSFESVADLWDSVISTSA